MIKILAFCFMLSGCAEVVVNNSLTAPTLQNAQTRTLHSYFWGFYTPGFADRRADLCSASRVERLEFYSETADVLLSVVTLGVYIPRELKFACAAR